MIDLYYWPTPNGRKISIMLEECGLEYALQRVDIGNGDQFDPDFLKISPNNRMPAIVDSDTGISVFEGGAILIYLAEKAGMLLPDEPAARFEALQWLFWQAGGLGPMAHSYRATNSEWRSELEMSDKCKCDSEIDMKTPSETA